MEIIPVQKFEYTSSGTHISKEKYISELQRDWEVEFPSILCQRA